MYLNDCVTGLGNEEEDQMHNLVVFSSNKDSTSYEKVARFEVCRKAMDLKIESIERNDTWKLSTLPKGLKPIGVKWVYKTKYNEMGKVDKHKSKLVAKGYSQRHDTDFNEVFALVAM